MARKPPNRRQPSLFPPDTSNAPEPQGHANQPTHTQPHALQDDHSRTPAPAPADARAVTEGTQTPDHAGDFRARTEGEPPGLEGSPGGQPSGQRPEPDRFGSDGNGTQ